jgi:hypothetical protein
LRVLIVDRLFFLHIPKTGGSTLSAALAKKFAAWEIFPWQHSLLDLFDPAELMKYRFFHGHFVIADLDYVPKPTKSVTLLREPGSRIVSLYNYWRSFRKEARPKGTPHHAWIANQVGLNGFLRLPNPSFRAAIDNALIRTYLPYPLRGRNRELTAPQETILDDALATLDRMTAFGILERWDESVRAIGGALQTEINLPAQKVRSFETLGAHGDHEAVERVLPNAETYDLLQAHTALDRLFYERAGKLFDAKFARHIGAGAEARACDRPAAPRASAYTWGEWINFGSDFHLDGVELTGWSLREEWGVWSITADPSLRIGPLRRPGGAVRLTIGVRGAVYHTHPVQTVEVVVNGRPIESWRFTLAAEGEDPARVLVLPDTAVDESGYLDLAFRVERPLSPLAAGISGDPRELGLGIECIHLESIA